MTPKDATDELRAEAKAVIEAWVDDLRIVPNTEDERCLEKVEMGIKRGMAIERARVCRELRELQSQFRARVVDVYKGQGHHDAGMRDGLTLAANRMDDLLNEIEAA